MGSENMRTMTITSKNGKPAIVDKYEMISITRTFETEKQLNRFINTEKATGMQIKVINKNEQEQDI
jgi:hypothetical protein